MPIMLIQEASPMRIRVEDDDGNLVGEMSLPVSGKSCDWKVTHGQGNGVNERFRMAPGGSGRGQELRIEFQ